MSDACVKCGGTDHYAREINANDGSGMNLVPIGFFTVAKIQVRVCGSCGFIEFRVAEKFLPKVREKFAKVP